jgi:hypothetical protein
LDDVIVENDHLKVREAERGRPTPASMVWILVPSPRSPSRPRLDLLKRGRLMHPRRPLRLLPRVLR